MIFHLIFNSLLASQVIEMDMDAIDKKNTGIYKLSDQEKTKLNQWIEDRYQKKISAAPKNNVLTPPTVSEIIRNGQALRLSDNSLWQIHPQDTLISGEWISAAPIQIEKTNDPKYPYKLTNTLTGSSVRAKKISQPQTPAKKP